MQKMVGQPNRNHQGIVVMDDLDQLMTGRAFIRGVFGK
jgi:hypothetical protein